MFKSSLFCLSVFFAIITLPHHCAAEPPLSICYVQLTTKPSDEDRAAIDWVQAHAEFRLTILQPGVAQIPSSGIVWIHLPDTAALIALHRHPEFAARLQAFACNGGRLLLTDYAALLPSEWNIEPRAPAVQIDTVPEEGLFDKKGFQSYRGHPLFSGLHNGEYILNPRRTMVYHQIGFFGSAYPSIGRVVAVDKSYITIHKDKKLIVEYSHGAGRILAVGSSVFFNFQNDLQQNFNLFMENAFAFLTAPEISPAATYWKPQTALPQPFTPPVFITQPAAAAFPLQQPEDIVLRDSGSAARFFDAAGRHIVAMGNEREGIDEIWSHPFRIIHDYHAGLMIGDSIVRLSEFPVRVEVRPESFSRIYSIPGGILREIIASSFDKPGVIVRYELESAKPARVHISFRPGMRWMWPYDADAFGGMRYGYDTAAHVLHVKDSTATFYALFGSDLAPERSKTIPVSIVSHSRHKTQFKPDGEQELLHNSEFILNTNEHNILNLILVGTNEGYAQAAETFAILKGNEAKEIAKTSAAYRSILNSGTAIQTPDSFFNLYYKWAMIGSSKFVASTPGVGTGLFAGYATTARGWDGGQKISGRPGYAWYFGRDAAWAGLAFDAVGDFETVKHQLILFQQWQDRSGKIFHELTTSGVVHYDASDATPLYLVLAADYLHSSGDTAFIRASWPNLKAAVDYLYTTDTDHDGLIENTNQGHGWMESGELFPMHTEIYLAGVWAKALQGMAEIAQVLDLSALREQYLRDANRVAALLNTEFWIDSLHFASFGKWSNGSYSTERGIAPAIPALFGFFERPKGIALADAYASSLFATDWGVHLISHDSKLFSPAGYNYGSVYPLFTGWAALAEYRYGRSTEAFSHIYENLYVKSFWSLGYSPEVIHGLQYLPSGVCPHQCWSETNTILPIVSGMIGWNPDAVHRSAVLSPRFPIQWDTVRIGQLHSGSTTIGFSMIRSKNEIFFQFRSSGPEILVHFAPELPAGTVVEQVLVDGTSLPIRLDSLTGLLSPAMDIHLSHNKTVSIKYRGGIGICPVMSAPRYGDSSRNSRIIRTSLTGKNFRIIVEGAAGGKDIFMLRLFDEDIKQLTGAEIVERLPNGYIRIEVNFPQTGKGFAEKAVDVELR